MILFFQRTCQQPTGMLVPALMAGSMIQRTSTGQHGNHSFLKKNRPTSWELVAEPYKVDPNISIGERRSIVSDLNWVCEESWIPAFSQVGLAVNEENRSSLTLTFTIFSPSSLSAQCLACSSLAGSGEKFEQTTIINLLFSATTTAGYQRFYPPTWLLLCPASQSPLSPNTSPSAFCGKFQLYPAWLQLLYGFLLLIILQLPVCDQ